CAGVVRVVLCAPLRLHPTERRLLLIALLLLLVQRPECLFPLGLSLPPPLQLLHLLFQRAQLLLRDDHTLSYPVALVSLALVISTLLRDVRLIRLPDALQGVGGQPSP